MADNFYEGWSEDELLKERRRVQERISSGAFTETASGGVRGVKVYETSPTVVLENISYALSVINPDDYPFTPQITRTKAIASN